MKNFIYCVICLVIGGCSTYRENQETQKVNTLDKKAYRTEHKILPAPVFLVADENGQVIDNRPMWKPKQESK